VNKAIAVAFIGLILATLVRAYSVMRTGRVEWSSPIGNWKYDRRETPFQFWGLAVSMALVGLIMITGAIFLAF